MKAFRLKSIICILILSMMLSTSCSSFIENSRSDAVITVGVTILPMKEYVRAVCGDLAEPVELVPPGASPSNYEPDPVRISKLDDAQIFFAIDLPAQLALDRSLFQGTKFVDLSDTVSDAYPDRYFDDEEDHAEEDGHSHTGKDPHIWLSPKRVIVMVQAIAEEMIRLDPDNEKAYTENASDYIASLNSLDEQVSEILSRMNSRKIFMFHPSLGYFADDYALEMYALEEDGKEATAGHLTQMIDLAKAESIKRIFIQAENAGLQAQTFADEIGGEVVQIDPLSENYIDNLIEIAQAVAGE
jgi:zinc transport system substrate-binding protein